MKVAQGAFLTIGGANRACIVMLNPGVTPNTLNAHTFDPTATTPALGTATSFGALGEHERLRHDHERVGADAGPDGAAAVLHGREERLHRRRAP
jgi:hypothetical protein